MAKFCASCGKQLPFENSELCPDCGVGIKPLSDIKPKLKPKKSEGHGAGKLLVIGVVFLIGLIIVALVFYYLTPGAGYITSGQADGLRAVTTQKSQETVYKGIEQATANIQMVGNMNGFASNPSAEIDKIRFSIGLAPGAPSVDLTKMTIVFTAEGGNPVTYAHASIASTGTFSSTINSGSAVNLLTANEQVRIDFKVTGVKPNTRMTMKIKPDTGAMLSVTRTAPPTISAVNILY